MGYDTRKCDGCGGPYRTSAAYTNRRLCEDCAPENPEEWHKALPDLEVGGVTYVTLTELSEALDEMFRLRRALAYEAQVVAAQTLDISRLGVNRRGHIEDSIERMTLAALGDAEVAYAGQSSVSLRHALRHIEASETLTRWNWRNPRSEATECAGASRTSRANGAPSEGLSGVEAARSVLKAADKDGAK